MTDAVLDTIITALGGIAIAILNRVRKDVNSRLSEMLELAKKSSKAEGVKEEHDREK